MKKYIFCLLPVILLFLGCSHPVQKSLPQVVDSGEITTGMGRVVIDQEESPKRTLLPDVPEFVSYTLQFQYQGESEAGRSDQIAITLPYSVDLPPGSWLITVIAYTRVEGVDGITDGNYPAASGSATVTVTSGVSVPVTVNLSSGTEIAGKGVFEYDIGLPEEGLFGATLRILNMDRSEVETRDLLESASGLIVLDVGYYLFQVQVSTGRLRSKTEPIHIYSGHTTRATGNAWNFNNEAGVYLTVEELSDFLAAAATNTADNPYPVKLIVNLDSLSIPTVYDYTESLGRLFQALHGKYINLDLSEATGSIVDADHDSRYLSEDRDKLISVILPDRLTHIGQGAFYNCTSLRSVVFPSSLQSIGLLTASFNGSIISSAPGAFHNCSSLKEINLPASLRDIGRSAFASCTSLKQATFPASLQNIMYGAFGACTSLEQVDFPASLLSIEDYAFSDTDLQAVDLSTCLFMGTIGNVTFGYCRDLETVILPPNLSIIPTSAFRECSSLTEINIPASVTTIGTFAFMGCSSLSSLDLPVAVVSIGAGAFGLCPNLTLEIPANSRLETIGVGAFGGRSLVLSGLQFLRSIGLASYYQANYDSLETLDLSGCVRLQSINLEAPVLKYVNLSGCTQLNSVTATGRVHLEEVDLSGCTSLTGANINFSDCTALTEVTLRPNIGNIPASAFTGCTSLDSLTFSGSQTPISIDFSALGWLKSVDLSACTALTALGVGVLSNSASLETVILPASITTIDGPVFQNYTSLKTLPVMPGIQSITNSAFEGCTGLYSGTGNLDLSAYTTLVSIGDNVFRNCRQITSFILPASLQNLGNAFVNCADLRTGLTSLDLSNTSLKTINGTFARFINLDSIVLPEGLETIGNDSFVSCSALAAINFPKSLKTIGNSAFGYSSNNETSFSTVYCSSLTIVDLSNCTALTSIGNSAFNGCRSLTTVDLSNCTALTNIGSSAFSALPTYPSLTTVDLSGCTALQNIGSAFSNQSYLTTVDLSDCALLQSISGTFDGCSSLTTMDLSRNTALTNIGTNTFSRCSSLTTLDLSMNTGLTSIGPGAFSRCRSLTTMDLSGSAILTSIGNMAFNNCAALTLLDLSGTNEPPVLERNDYTEIMHFSGTPDNLVIYVPAGSVAAYRNAEYWSDYASQIQAKP